MPGVASFGANTPKMREFASGGTRHSDEGKIDFEGCLSPLVLQKYAEYMLLHTTQADGRKRGSDNWQGHFGGDHFSICAKSFLRHAWDFWLAHRGLPNREGIESAIHGCLFNLMAYADKYYKDRLK